MKICVLVKEVPEVGVERRIDPGTGRLDRSGEGTLNAFDAHAVEAAVRLREGGAMAVEEIVAVTMGPPSAARALRRAVALGVDRSVHLTDEALAGSDLAATGYALARVLRAQAPGLVLLGQQSGDGECYSVGAVVAEHLAMPALTQAIRIEARERTLVCERQAEYGYDTVEVELPAVISVGDAINEPRYPSLRAIMAARSKPLATVSIADAGIDPGRVGVAGSRTRVLRVDPPPRRPPGEKVEESDADAAVERIVAWLEDRRLLA